MPMGAVSSGRQVSNSPTPSAGFSPASWPATPRDLTEIALSDEPAPSDCKANAFLRENGFETVVLNGGKLIDKADLEAQLPPSVKVLERISRALVMAEETSAKSAVTRALWPAILTQLLDHAEVDGSPKSWQTWATKAIKSYFGVLGCRDLAIDDVIAAINNYFFDKIGRDSTLNISNIVGAALTANFMLLPTIGKQLPQLMKALTDRDCQGVIRQAFPIAAVSAMTLNPTLAAFGLDRASAIAASAGNALMMANLPEVLHNAYETVRLKWDSPNPESHPFTSYLRTRGVVDKGLHTVLDFLHEVLAQAGLFSRNLENAIRGDDASSNPLTFVWLAVLLGSFAASAVRGERPLDDISTDPKALGGKLASGADPRQLAAKLFLHQKIADIHNPNCRDLIRPHLKPSALDHVFTRFGGRVFSDQDEKTFLKGVVDLLYPDKGCRDAAHVAIDRIWRFDDFDPSNHASGDRSIGAFLSAVQTERARDKGIGRDSCGLMNANHVYDNIILPAIIAFSLKEARQDNVGAT